MDPKIASEVDDLLRGMTLDEKLAQLGAYFFFDTYWNKHSATTAAERIAYIQSVTAAEMIPAAGLGFVSTQLRDLPARAAAEKANENQRHILAHTRSRIPVVVHDEGVHGLIGNGATCFPSALGMAASWDVELMESVAHAIGREARTRGIRQLLSPTLNLGRDPRCGRTEETYGEDPHLASRFGVAFVRGVQGERVICTPKHFVANFEGDGGRDSTATQFSERFLREVLFPPFEAVVKEAGALSLMAAYNALDGTPCSGNRWLLTDVLRGEWGFEGYVVSDYHSVIHQWELHKTAATMGEAATKSLEAGLEVELPRHRCYDEPLRAELAAGRIAPEVIDEATRRVLHVKKKMGIFEDRVADPDEAERVSNCAEHRALAREMARRSLVLLRNERDVLPLEGIRSLAIIGPNADAIEVGDYSWDLYDKDHVVTPLAGVRAAAGTSIRIEVAPGCGIADGDRGGIPAACDAARRSDAAVVFVGNSVKLTGEARDCTSLDLPGVQAELIEAVAATGKPVIVVVITSSVHTIGRWIDKTAAVLHAWYPGEEGGNAIADVLFGKVSPSGRLPITIPRTVGQCPVYYYHKPSGRGNTYGNLGQDGGIQFPFGFGLGYTTFVYTDLVFDRDRLPAGCDLRVRCTITNAGKRAGSEVVQLYLADLLASVTRPLKELKAFLRVALEPGESRVVEFVLPAEAFSMLDARLVRRIEPGAFEVMVGASCEDIRLRGTVDVT